MSDAPAAKREQMEATVIGSLPNAMYAVRLQGGQEVTAHAAQDLRMAYVRLVVGDVVAIELSPFDPDKARITKLLKKQQQQRQQEPTRPTETNT